MSKENGMRYERILFLNPPAESELGSTRPSVGIGVIAEYLARHEINYEVMDMRLGHNMNDVKELIQSFKPDLVGVSLFSHGYRHVYDFVCEVRKQNHQFDIIVGGPHVSLLRNDVLTDCEAIDFGVVMEGEETLLDLCKGEPVKEIKGLIHRENGKIVFNGERIFIEDLDSIPFPKYEKFELRKYIPEKYIVSTRGCPYQCIFCPNSLIIGNKMRFRSAENIVEEIGYWYEKGYRQFNFVDDNFTIRQSRVYEICDKIEKENFERLFLRCSNGIRADSVDYDLLARMKSVGFKHLCFGVEGGNDKILKILKKGENIQTIEAAIRDACELDYDVALFFVVGSPGETWDDVMDSARIAEKYPIMRASFYNLLPFPRTELFDWVGTNGYFVLEPEEYLNEFEKYDIQPVFETPELTKDQRVEAMQYLRKVEKRITRRAVERKLQWLPVLNSVVGYCFASNLLQGLLFSNSGFRKLAEWMRYKFYSQ